MNPPLDPEVTKTRSYLLYGVMVGALNLTVAVLQGLLPKAFRFPDTH